MILGISCTASFIALSLMLFALQSYFKEEIRSQELLIISFKQESGIQDSVLNELTKQNATISNLDKFYKEQILPSDALERISKHVPEDIFLTAVLFSPKETGKANLVLRGHASTRESLLRLRESLSQDELFEDIQFPLSNFATPKEINFSTSLLFAP